MRTTPRTYRPAPPIWCAGCGHYGVLSALEAAIRELNIPLHEIVVVAGIGCSGTIQNHVGAYGYHALHGRVLPTATGIALADPNLTVIGAGGDGDGYAIGAGHLVHAFRRNPSVTYVVMNNQTYGLTKGQRSPTTETVSPSHIDAPLDAAQLGLAIAGTTFVARGFSGWPEQLGRLMHAAIEHARARRGFAFLEVVSPCVTYCDTYDDWAHGLHDVDADEAYDPANRMEAAEVAHMLAAVGKLPAGLLYRAPVARRPPERPEPAYAPTEPSSMRPAYEAMLDTYAVAPRR